MDSVKVRTTYDYKAFKYCNWYMLKYGRKVYVAYTIFAIVAILAGALMWVFNAEQYLFAIIFLVLGAYSIYQMITLEKKLDRNLERHFNAHEPFEQIIELNDEKIIIQPTDTMEPQEYDWAYVSEIHCIKQYYFLRFGTAYIIIDRNEEALVEGSQETVDKILTEKGQAKPFKKFDGEVVTKPITFVQTYVAPKAAVDAEMVEDHPQIVENIESEDNYEAN